MTRLIYFAAASAMALMGQDAKIAAGPQGVKASPATERPLTETEVLKIQLVAAKIELLQKKYDVAGFQRETQPLSDQQAAIIQAACESVGVPKDKLQAECRVQIGFDQDGKQVMGPDGKPVTPKVWREIGKPNPISYTPSTARPAKEKAK